MTTLPPNHPLPRGFSKFADPFGQELDHERRALRAARINAEDLRRMIAARNWQGAAKCASLMLYEAGDRSVIGHHTLSPDFDRRSLPLLAYNIRRAVRCRKNVFAAINQVHNALCC